MPTKKKSKKCLFVSVALIVALGLSIVNAVSIEPNRFVVTRHQLGKHLLDREYSFKIVQISDLHLKKFNNRARQIADRVNQLQPDIVVFTGDSIDRAEQLNGFEQFLSLLNTVNSLQRLERGGYTENLPNLINRDVR
jgi:uncharacterized protein